MITRRSELATFKVQPEKGGEGGGKVVLAYLLAGGCNWTAAKYEPVACMYIEDWREVRGIFCQLVNYDVGSFISSSLNATDLLDEYKVAVQAKP
jgi:hypothetical protein